MNGARRALFGLLLALTLSLLGVAHADDVLRVGTDSTFPAFEYVEHGRRVGFDIELIEAIELVEVDKNQDAFQRVETGRADAAVTGTPQTLRLRRTLPSPPVIPVGAGGAAATLRGVRPWRAPASARVPPPER
jgi:ABC-type amino acid transport substrate-binding protein